MTCLKLLSNRHDNSSTMSYVMRSTGENKHPHWDPKLADALSYEMFDQIKDRDNNYCGVSVFTWRGSCRWEARDGWLADHGYLKDFPDLDEANLDDARQS